VNGEDKAVIYTDDFGLAGEGQVFYPESLRIVAEFLAELNRQDIEKPAEFSNSIRLYLDLILGRFRSFHDTHSQAQANHNAYRTSKRQYLVYLRSFTLGGLAIRTGFTGDRLTQELGMTSVDREHRRLLKSWLPAGMNSLSFINTFDLYPSGNEQDADYMRCVTIPSFRVLSHNWKDVVREVVRGANLIVLRIQASTEGVGHEIEIVRECGLADRTIVEGDKESLARAPLDGFRDVIEIERGGVNIGPSATDRLSRSMRALVGDGFTQTNQVADLSELRCWVVDRQIDLAARQFEAATLEGIPHENYIPSSLASNWAILTTLFPQMNELLAEIDARLKGTHPLGTDQLAKAMYAAIRVFYVATTLERYYEMAQALGTMGFAHRLITRDIEIMAACYRHAADCARWHRDADLTAFYANAYSQLEQEIAAKQSTASNRSRSS
jgi:hypothetical protein